MTDDRTATVQAATDNTPVLIFRSTSGRTEIARWTDGTHSIHVLHGKDTLDADDISGLTQIFARDDVTEDDANETADTPKICDALCRDVEEDRDHLAAQAEQLRYERTLLGACRRLLDNLAENAISANLRRTAGDLAQRIVDEIGHPVTDEPALGPDLRAELAQAVASRDSLRQRLRATSDALNDARNQLAAFAAVTAENLAVGRQSLAHKGVGYLPAWSELTEHEREMAVLEASNWLNALRCAIQATAPTA